MVVYQDTTNKFGHKGRWLLLDTKRKRVLRIFPKKPTKEQVLKEERRIQYFKHFASVPTHLRKGKIVRGYVRRC